MVEENKTAAAVKVNLPPHLLRPLNKPLHFDLARELNIAAAEKGLAN